MVVSRKKKKKKFKRFYEGTYKRSYRNSSVLREQTAFYELPRLHVRTLDSARSEPFSFAPQPNDHLV